MAKKRGAGYGTAAPTHRAPGAPGASDEVVPMVRSRFPVLPAVLAAAILAAAACKKAEPAGDPAQGEKPVTKTNKVTLPPAGTAPPPVQVDADFASVWTAPLKTLSGKPTQLAEQKGKALLLVNVASKCGLTPQYAALEALQEKYGPKGFSVVGFPSNQFAGQEPGSAEEIQEFCSTTYGITFPMTEKVDVNGDGAHPVYQTLTKIPDASGHKGDIRWNFEKFVVSADGTQVTRFSPKTTPDDPAVIAAVENALPH
jgi:glutathione peroxidase